MYSTNYTVFEFEYKSILKEIVSFITSYKEMIFELKTIWIWK